MSKPTGERGSAPKEVRRAVLKKAGRFVAVSAPAVTLLLAATAKSKKAMAISVE
jgi:hypothetical protein